MAIPMRRIKIPRLGDISPSKRIPRRYHRHALLFLLSLGLVIAFHVQEELFRIRLEHIVSYAIKEIGVRDPNVTCIFPLHHPFDSSILSHIHLARPVRCISSNKPYLQIDESGRLSWNVTALAENGYPPDGGSLHCTYQEIWRSDLDDFNVGFSEARAFSGEPATLVSDYVYAECTSWLGFTVYRDYLARVQKLKGIRKYKSGELDVLVIGLDSMSRLNFMRQLPKAYHLLTKELGGTVLIGFNKVGANTFPNVVPMLTGRPIIPEPHTNFKEWPFIWKDYAKAGAVTMYAEDQPWINMFDFLAEGIDEQPTHHYMHTFWLAVDKSLLRKSSSRLCLGPRPKFDIYFSYLKSFIKAYSEEPKFLFSLMNEPTHNFLNTAGVIDDVFTDFLNSSYNEGLFNRSAVVILGDHGQRLDTIRSTELGKIEDSMPMVTVLLPKWVNSTWRSNLKKNSNRLTSTYDLYQTFVDILDTLGGTPGPSGNKDRRIWDHFSQPTKGQSLFTEIKASRSCSEAGIPDWICVCSQEEERLQPDDPTVKVAVESVISHINNLLGEFPACAKLTLKTVKLAARKLKENIIVLTFDVNPSGGLFEATLSNKGETYSVDDIQRINAYGKQASCLGEEILMKNALYKATCFCKSRFG